eukprot:49916-Eustigmatos_ZCMA.PRE.1
MLNSLLALVVYRSSATMRTARGGLLPAVSLLGLLSSGARVHSLDDCKNALRNLRMAPYNTSLPFLSAATGEASARYLPLTQGVGQ